MKDTVRKVFIRNPRKIHFCDTCGGKMEGAYFLNVIRYKGTLVNKKICIGCDYQDFMSERYPKSKSRIYIIACVIAIALAVLFFIIY